MLWVVGFAVELPDVERAGYLGLECMKRRARLPRGAAYLYTFPSIHSEIHNAVAPVNRDSHCEYPAISETPHQPSQAPWQPPLAKTENLLIAIQKLIVILGWYRVANLQSDLGISAIDFLVSAASRVRSTRVAFVHCAIERANAEGR